MLLQLSKQFLDTQTLVIFSTFSIELCTVQTRNSLVLMRHPWQRRGLNQPLFTSITLSDSMKEMES